MFEFLSKTFKKRAVIMVLIMVLIVPYFSFVHKPTPAYALPVLQQACEFINGILSKVSFSIAGTKVPIKDGSNDAKDQCQDLLISIVVDGIIRNMLKSITRWAKNGFQGGFGGIWPIFIDRMTDYVRTVEGFALESLLNELDFLEAIGIDDQAGFFCGPFSQDIRNALKVTLEFNRTDKHYLAKSKCSISHLVSESGNVMKNLQADFAGGGGWPVWLRLIENENNRYGASYEAIEEAWTKQQEAEEQATFRLTLGGGAESQITRECLDPWHPDQEGSGVPPLYLRDPYRADGTLKCYDWAPEKVRTPGSIISNQINDTLGLSNSRLAASDEIGELITGILQGVVLKIFESDGGFNDAGYKKPEDAESFYDLLDGADPYENVGNTVNGSGWPDPPPEPTPEEADAIAAEAEERFCLRFPWKCPDVEEILQRQVDDRRRNTDRVVDSLDEVYDKLDDLKIDITIEN